MSHTLFLEELISRRIYTPLKRREHIKRATGHRKEETQSEPTRLLPMEAGEEDPGRRAVPQPAGTGQRSQFAISKICNCH